MKYKGNKWYKCDLHLHTTASKCFQDRSVTPEQWVDRAIEQGLQCVAVTDHNTGAGIDSVMLAAKSRDLVVFPGVEITCDTTKIHLLILFDTDKTSTTIEDFLIKCKIKREDFGEQEAHTLMTIFEVAQIAHDAGAIIIPAHIDEYNGLGKSSAAAIKSFFGLEFINAVHVVHKEFLIPELKTSDNNELKVVLNDYYNNPPTPIDDSTLKEWHSPVKYAIEFNLALLTFSDNPHEPKNSKHGVDGIGSRFTWIKMDEVPSLEGLRQAILLPQFRIKNEFDCPGEPYLEPEIWIKAITIKDTAITEKAIPLTIEFSPQMNTIIGGRGSGKSSILRFIRGVFNRTHDLDDLQEIFEDHNNFYKTEGGRPKIGVFNAQSIIEILVIRRGLQYRISVSGITNSDIQTRKIEIYNEKNSVWEEISDEGFIDFFTFEHYSQKQIYEIAQAPNALRERIDSSIDSINGIKSAREQLRNKFLEISAAIRTSKQVVAGKGKVLTKMKDLDFSLQKLQSSGIADILSKRNTFVNQEKTIDEYIQSLNVQLFHIDSMINMLESQELNLTEFDISYHTELAQISESTSVGFESILAEIMKQKETLVTLIQITTKSLKKSQWRTDYDANFAEFESKKEELLSDGINDIGNFEKYSNEKTQLEVELKDILDKEVVLIADNLERNRIQVDFLESCKTITQQRRDFIATVIQHGKIKINIKPFRNKSDFHNRFREIIQRDGGFDSSIDSISNLIFDGNVENKLQEFRKLILDIRNNNEVLLDGIDGHFKNLISRLTDAQIDELELIIPEDEIEVQYKPIESSGFKSLSTASAGQKTTAILTYLLSQGSVPLILDQPEDDLDNRLVYELVVDRLKKAKEFRQIIVVTHNANIPVNGDAELIISMSSDSKLLKVFQTGTVEQPLIKKEICDVMEGTEQAFEMRSRRYKQIKSI